MPKTRISGFECLKLENIVALTTLDCEEEVALNAKLKIWW